MSDFDIGKLKRELGEVSQKLESDRDFISEKVLEFCNRFLNHSDIICVAKHDSKDTRYQEINRICERYIEENLSEQEVKSLLSGNKVEPTEGGQINKIFKNWVRYHLHTDKALQTSNRFFSQITFEPEDLELLSDFPNNLSDGRVKELLIVFGEFYDGVVDIKGCEQNLYPNRYTEVKKTVRYRNDVANWVGRKTEEITKIVPVEPEPEPQISNVENTSNGFVRVRWFGAGANGSFSIITRRGRETVYREKTYEVSNQMYQNLIKQKPVSWRLA